MQRRHSPADPLRSLLFIAAGVLALYLLTLSRVQTWETIAQAARATDHPILSERYFSTRLFHPNHLLYMPLARAGYRTLAALGVAREPFVPLQAASAVCGALAALLSGLVVLRLGAGTGRAVSATLGAGISNALWRLSTEIGAIVPAVCLVMLGAWAMSAARSRRAWLLAGLALGAGTLIHQMAVLFALAASVTLALACWPRHASGDAGKARVRVVDALAFVVGWSLPVLAGYVALGVASGARSPSALLDWILELRARSPYLTQSAISILRQSSLGMPDAWVTLLPLRAIAAGNAGAAVGLSALGVLAGLAGGACLLGAALPAIARAALRGEPITRTLTLGGLAIAAFVLWYQPSSHVFWVFLPPIACTLVALHLPPLGRIAHAAVAMVIAVVAMVNLIARALPAMDPERAPYTDLQAFARGHLATGDVLVTDAARSRIGEGLVVLPYYAGVEVLSVPRPDDSAEQRRFDRDLSRALAASAAGGAQVFALAEVMSRVRSLRPEAVPESVGVLRGAAVYRIAHPRSGRLTPPAR